MTTELVVGLFAVLGAVVGGLFTYLAARVGHDWDTVKNDVARLCDQVIAYHTLEELYKDELARLDPSRGKPKTVQQEMRESVQGKSGVVRPTMTANEARKLKDRWT
jgi:ABC-type uncharacterized transport system ATPase subunit